MSCLYLFALFYGTTNAQDEYDVIIMGAGMTGIQAGYRLQELGIDNFIILEAQSYMGGRVNYIDFHGSRVNTGGSWISGACENFNDGSSCRYMGSNPRGINPLLALTAKYNVPWVRTDIHEWRLPFPPYLNGTNGNTISRPVVIAEYNRWLGEVSECLMEKINDIWMGWAVDVSYMDALRGCLWFSQITLSQVITWIEFNLEYAYDIEQYSVYMTELETYVYYGNQDLLTLDNGFRGVVEGIAGEYLLPNDPRIVLNAPVGNIEYNANTGVTVTIAGTSLQYHAKYALVTFPIGVLKNRNFPATAIFNPPLPNWKQAAIDATDVADYSPLLVKWYSNWWFSAGHPEIDTGSKDGIVVLVDDEYGNLIWFINFNHDNIRPGSLIWRFDITDELAVKYQQQNNDDTIAALKTKLSRYFDVVPDPESVFVAGWSYNQYIQGAYGAYPVGYDWDNNIVDLQYAADQVLYFAGEHTSYDNAGYVHGAYYEGIRGANFIGNCLGASTGEWCQGPYTKNAREKAVMHLRNNSTKYQRISKRTNKKPKWAVNDNSKKSMY
eukprot:712215_1